MSRSLQVRRSVTVLALGAALFLPAGLAAAPSALASGGGHTVPTPPASGTGFLAIIPGGTGSGRITSQPTGIDCVITSAGTSGPCQAFFPAGSTVKLDVRTAAGSAFQGWRGLPGCTKAPNVTIVQNTNIFCQPGIALKF